MMLQIEGIDRSSPSKVDDLCTMLNFFGYSSHEDIRIGSVVNLIKHFTIIIFDSRIVLTTNLPILQL